MKVVNRGKKDIRMESRKGVHSINKECKKEP